MRPWLPTVVGLALMTGCPRPGAGPAVPEAALHPAPRSSLMGEVDEFIAALATQDVDRIGARLTARLHERLHEGALLRAAQDLRARYGEPRGIMEEHVQHEGALTWYSGLVIHARGKGPPVLTPVLYQIAFTRNRQIERLLVREHWFIEHVQAPAEDYVPITRLHVPATSVWTVAQGGTTAQLNAHHGSESQRFAYDLVLVEDGRFRDPDMDPSLNESYYGYGQPLRAPAAGVVRRVVDGVPDNVPKARGEGGGNGVVIDHGFGEVSALWHARPGSLRVAEGDHVEPGQIVAEVGNTGRSTGAHIHLHLTRDDEQLALPAPFVDIVVDGVPHDRTLPIRGTKVEGRLPIPSPPALADGPRVFIDV